MKFENDAIARFCSSVDNSKKWGEKKPSETGSITRLTKSTSRSIITEHSTMYELLFHLYIYVSRDKLQVTCNNILPSMYHSVAGGGYKVDVEEHGHNSRKRKQPF